MVIELSFNLLLELQQALQDVYLAPYHREKLGENVWKVDKEGDCEDKVLWMRRQLRDKNWPMESMDIVACDSEKGKHIVLRVKNLKLSDGQIVNMILDPAKNHLEIESHLSMVDCVVI